MDDPRIGPIALDVVLEQPAPPRRSTGSLVVLGLGLALIALNLRPVFSSLSVLLPEIRAETGLSAGALSALTTLPVLCLGVFAPLAPGLARRFGPERVLLGVVLLVALGTALRGLGAVPLLFLGTAIAGFAIALGNTLLPSVVKREFPNHFALVTGVYSMALCGGAALGAAFTLPIDKAIADAGVAGSWRVALAAWAIPALVAAALWLVQCRRQTTATVRHAAFGRLLRDPLAWQVTLFMGLQSSLAYIVFGWLAPILRKRGVEGVDAGVIVSFSIILQVAASILVPSLSAKARDQRLISVSLVALAVIGLFGMMFVPRELIWLFALPQGIGQGGLFAIAMTIIVLRSPDALVTAELSGMAQGIGYTFAAGGPLLMGLLLDASRGLAGPAILIGTIGIFAVAMGLGAGRKRLVGQAS